MNVRCTLVWRFPWRCRRLFSTEQKYTDDQVAMMRLKALVVDTGSVQRLFRRRLDNKQVYVIPMKHVASQEFYDSVLEELQAPEITAVMVEGVLDNREALEVEFRELRRLQQEPELGKRIVQRILAGTYWPAGTIQQEIQAYGVPLEIAARLQLTSQEKYWRALLKCMLPQKVVPSDVFDADIEAQPDANSVRICRMEHLFATINDSLQNHDTIAVCWGFHHTTQIEVGLLQHGFLASPRTQSRSFGWTAEAFQIYIRTLTMRGMYDARALDSAPDPAPAPDRSQ